ncbi:single-stranded DNA-binding protein [Corynebacterium terpenotabidum]|uniref:Single-stranded DNA-binding protein n=1 Tax=Corynebacterium terpenotabidum Y-11 TaxID=1200352 RepID=S4XCT5_9CORY|nr:single-stranded DNA-binding protein [Corynebacterium terpenotabidum]AGP30334.1 Single-stranded DNA-binding protein [Corynebacterium terpenotabidum Y-11]
MAVQQMSVTMTGFAASNPSRSDAVPNLTTFRMASTPSWKDNGVWKDGGTLFIEVQCWGRLADHVLPSVVKGAPLVIAGRMTSYTYVPGEENCRRNRDGDPVPETVWRLTASNVGLDLSHSPSTWSLKDRPRKADREGDQDGQERAREALEAAGYGSYGGSFTSDGADTDLAPGADSAEVGGGNGAEVGGGSGSGSGGGSGPEGQDAPGEQQYAATGGESTPF